MTSAMWLTLGVFAATTLFQIGGFCWLAMNHFRSVNRRLDKLETGQNILAEGLNYIRGRLDGDLE